MPNLRLSLRHSLVLASGALTLLLAGCAFSGTGTTTSATTGGSTSSAQKGLGGTIHGGKQAIYNSTVSLYAMNTSTGNYGDTPTLYATTHTGFDGSFNFVRGADGGTNSGSAGTALYSCPTGAGTGSAGSATDPEMYLVASGGDTSGTINLSNAGSAYNNTAVKFYLAIGDCNSLSAATQVVMNELTTVGTIVSLQQFFNPATEAIGAPSTNVSGLVNAIGMIPNLVNVGTGAVQSAVNPTSTVPGITITATPEFQKLNTIANILAACVSSSSASSTACSTLFANAVPPNSAASTNFSSTSYTPATDTALALDYMFINPTESQDYAAGSGKLFNLYNLPTTSTAPFAPVLAAQPMDWTIGVQFTPSGTCTNTTVAGTPQPLLNDSYGIAVDAAGNVWLGGGGGTSTNPGVLAKISPSGGALKCLNVGDGGNTTGRRVAIDNNGNVWWVTDQGIMEYVVDAGNTAVGTMLTWPLPGGGTIKGSGLAADQNGNIFVAPEAGAAQIYEYPAVSTLSAPFAGTSIVALGSTQLSATGKPYRDIVVSINGNLLTEGTGSTRYVYAFVGSGVTYTDSLVTLTSAADSTSYGLAGASDGTVVGGNTCCARAGGLYRVSLTTTTPAQVNYSANYAGGQNADRSIAIDGADNIWTGGATYANDSTGTLSTMAETDKSYAAISPAGTTPSSCATTPANGCDAFGGFSKSFFVLDSTYALAVDGSGNVWGAPDSGSHLWYWAIIGQAVPLKTPIVSNLH